MTAGGAEAQTDKVYQLSGMVLNRSTHQPVPYVRIVTHRGDRYAIAGPEGFYSLPVTPKDSLYFQCIGYKTSKLSVAAYLKNYENAEKETYIYAIHFMDVDTLLLPDVIITPYKTRADIRNALVFSNSPYLDAAQAAQANLSPELMSFLMGSLPKDEGERLAVAQQRYVTMLSQQSNRATVTIVDPVAVYSLIKHISKKSKARKDEIYRSFPDE